MSPSHYQVLDDQKCIDALKMSKNSKDLSETCECFPGIVLDANKDTSRRCIHFMVVKTSRNNV
jgi:hypothetical protein